MVSSSIATGKVRTGCVGGEGLRPAGTSGRTASRGAGTPRYRRRRRTRPRRAGRRRASSGPRSRRASPSQLKTPISTPSTLDELHWPPRGALRLCRRCGLSSNPYSESRILAMPSTGPGAARRPVPDNGDAMQPDLAQPRAELTLRPPDPIRVGAGTAFQLGGSSTHRRRPDPSGSASATASARSTRIRCPRSAPTAPEPSGGRWSSPAGTAGRAGRRPELAVDRRGESSLGRVEPSRRDGRPSRPEPEAGGGR